VIHTFLDPSIDQVRLHTAAVIRELVGAHEIDALVLDNLRYPLDGSRWGYSAMALENYHRAVGEVGLPEPEDLTFGEWRRDQATTLLRVIVEAVRSVRPRLSIYVCAEANGSIDQGFRQSDTHRENLQDWARWIDEGLCDGIIVKIFRDGRSGPEAEEFERWLEFARTFEPRTEVFIAASGHFNYRNGLFRLIRAVTQSGLGFALYDYDRPARDHGTRFTLRGAARGRAHRSGHGGDAPHGGGNISVRPGAAHRRRGFRADDRADRPRRPRSQCDSSPTHLSRAARRATHRPAR
jgi:hypothetical protein